jgi:hypothetical protein
MKDSKLKDNVTPEKAYLGLLKKGLARYRFGQEVQAPKTP